MVSQKEIPPYTLDESREMVLYFGYITDDVRIRCYVPTTVFNKKVAVIKAYQMEKDSAQLPNIPELILAEKYVKLKSLPGYNRNQLRLELNKEDEQAVSIACDNLEEKLRKA